MQCIIQPAALTGTVQAISSKSVLHRQLICAALSNAPTRIVGCTFSEDIQATIRCLQGLGADIRQTDTNMIVTPIDHTPASPLLDCGESGSTLRFLLPVAAALGGARFTGGGRLPARPLDALIETMASHGVQANGVRLPVRITGGLQAGTYMLPGNVSSQYITGLLFALPLLQKNSRILLTTPLSSRGYID
ncbi:MAG: 3-phosphoshikimate 1-carboxyvinyltransferase, partial [Eubacteriales bacterium]|nr:3-phosphoshikimate 1-carboxyvinyltransferase [Eubacteriales bacterium]